MQTSYNEKFTRGVMETLKSKPQNAMQQYDLVAVSYGRHSAQLVSDLQDD